MSGLNLLEHGTSVFETKLENSIRRTVQGMAYFSGTGPNGKSCKTCAHFEFDKMVPQAPQPCQENLRQRRGQKTKKGTRIQRPKIPPTTACCKYYEDRV